MTRRQFLISIAVVGWLGVRPARGRAQDERDVYGDVVKWLKTLFRPLSEIGELIDQTRFVASLTDLATTFEAMLNDTREIVEILERPQLDRYALTQVGTRLSETIVAAEELESRGLSTTVADARFAKPLDEALVLPLAREHEVLITPFRPKQ